MAGELVTILEAKDWLGLPVADTDDDDKIGRAIGAASRTIDSYCGRRFGAVTGDRVFDSGRDAGLLRINDASAVTAVATDDNDDGIFETVWATSDYQLLPLNAATAPVPRPYTQIRALGGRRFPRSTLGRSGLVQVTATWGWDPVPDDVKQAALILMARLVKRKESPQGVAGSDQFGVIRISKNDDPDVVRLLSPYVGLQVA